MGVFSSEKKLVFVQQSGSKSAGNQQLRMERDRGHFGHRRSRWLEKENVQIQPENIEIPEGTEGGEHQSLSCECHSIHVWYIYLHLPHFTIKKQRFM